MPVKRPALQHWEVTFYGHPPVDVRARSRKAALAAAITKLNLHYSAENLVTDRNTFLGGWLIRNRQFRPRIIGEFKTKRK